MSQAKRVTDLEKQTGIGGDIVTVTIDDRKDHIDFVRWLRRMQGKDDKGPVEISPEEEITFRPPFTANYTKPEWEESNQVIREWLRVAVAGKKGRGVRS